MTNKQALAFLILMGTIFIIQSCKLGCNDKNAFNYSSSAKENDGSCLYCDSAVVANGSNWYQVVDENSQSLYAFQSVLRAVISSQEIQYSGNGCSLLGYNNGTSACNKYINNLQLINLTSSKITFTGQLLINYSSQSSNTQASVVYNFNSAQVSAFDTLNLGNIGDACLPGDNAFFELNMNNGYSIQYH